MSKYIIELDYDLQRVVGVGVKQGTVWVKDYDVDDLEELCADYINEHFGDLQDTAYQRGLEEGKKATFELVADASNAEYQKGFEDGKESIHKGCEGCRYSGTPQGDSPCFSCSNYYSNNWQKQDDEINVGDEVEISQSDANGIWVVIKVEKHDGYEAYCAINKDGDIYFEEEQDRVTKTGRHFDIESILEDMRCGQ